MQRDERLIIFAQPRSGSNSLLRVLQLHPDLELLEEPFNERHLSWWGREYRARIRDVRSFDAVLREIFAEYDGFKTLPYQLPEKLNRRMLLAPRRRIVFLRRRNLLKAVVSGQIADQTGLWHPSWASKPVLDYYSALQPLSVKETAGRLAHERSMIQGYARLLSRLPASRCLHVFYEDVFTSPLEQQAQIDRVLEFLDLETMPLDAARQFLDPAQARLNSEQTYARVPNIVEIDDALGSDEHGRLFDGA